MSIIQVMDGEYNTRAKNGGEILVYEFLGLYDGTILN